MSRGHLENKTEKKGEEGCEPSKIIFLQKLKIIETID